MMQNIPAMKIPLPKGKLNMRHRQMRGVWQIFAGRTYITGASSDTCEGAAQELANQYEVEVGSEIFVHSGKNSHVVKTPECDPWIEETFTWKLRTNECKHQTNPCSKTRP